MDIVVFLYVFFEIVDWSVLIVFVFWVIVFGGVYVLIFGYFKMVFVFWLVGSGVG